MDISDLLQPISPEVPCGTDLDDYDGNPDLSTAFSRLEAMTYGEFKDGATQPPRWPVIIVEALEMAHKSKHLRLGTMLVEGGCITEGFSGIRDGLHLIHEWCSQYWEGLYPLQERNLVLESLNHPRFLVKPRQVIVASARGGSYSFDDYERAKDTGTNSSDEEASNQARLIMGAFAETPREKHLGTLACIQESLEFCRNIEDTFDEKGGSGGGVNLGDFRDFLSKAAKILEPYVQEAGSSGDSADGEAGFSAGPGGQGAMSVDGVINSRQAASAVLEKVAQFFERSEPSSPIPHLVRRAQRCIGKSFMELIDELSIDPTQANTILTPSSRSEQD